MTRRAEPPLVAVFLALLACAGLGQPEAPTPPAPEGVLPTAWRALRAAGCDPVKAHVWTPIEARVLRQAPAAGCGRELETPELTALYRSDGGWYTPGEGCEIPAEDAACVARLAAWERELRTQMDVPPAYEARLLGDLSTFQGLREHGARFGGLRQAAIVDSPMGTTDWMLLDAKCPVDSEECSGLRVACPVAGGACTVGFGG